MALDKAIDSAQLDSGLRSVADAVRARGGTSAALAFPAGFVSAIGDLAAYTPANTAVTFQNASDSAGNLGITWAGYRGTAQAICPVVYSAVTLAKGGTRTCSNNILLYDGAVGLLVNNSIISVTCGGEDLAFQSEASGTYRYLKIFLPDGFDNSHNIVLKR